jgi:serine phosphatase RsbU (regulator of sigma subunit)
MAGVAIARLVLGIHVGLLPLLAVGPALAAGLAGIRLTVVAGAAAIAACVLLTFVQPPATMLRDLIALSAVVAVTGAAVLATAVRQRRDRELADVRAVAEVAQQVVLRPVPAEVGPLRFAVRYMSAQAGAQIGGDLYDVVLTDGGVRLVLGDVQGKGLPAVRTAASVLAAYREAAYYAPDLEAVADRVEVVISRQLAEEEFVTAVLAELVGDMSKVELLNCGHPPPLLISAGTARFVGSAGGCTPLGLLPLADEPRTHLTVPFGPGDRILFYTDGVSEARDAAGAYFPLARSAATWSSLPPEQFLDRLRDAVVRHVGHKPNDDVALLLLSWEERTG